MDSWLPTENNFSLESPKEPVAVAIIPCEGEVSDVLSTFNFSVACDTGSNGFLPIPLSILVTSSKYVPHLWSFFKSDTWNSG